jgi:hypothetical protein
MKVEDAAWYRPQQRPGNDLTKIGKQTNGRAT